MRQSRGEDLMTKRKPSKQAGSKTVRDKVYKTYDDTYPNRRTHEKRFRDTIDAIKGIFDTDLARSQFRAIRLLYPLFCAVR